MKVRPIKGQERHTWHGMARFVGAQNSVGWPQPPRDGSLVSREKQSSERRKLEAHTRCTPTSKIYSARTSQGRAFPVKKLHYGKRTGQEGHTCTQRSVCEMERTRWDKKTILKWSLEQKYLLKSQQLVPYFILFFYWLPFLLYAHINTSFFLWTSVFVSWR